MRRPRQRCRSPKPTAAIVRSIRMRLRGSLRPESHRAKLEANAISSQSFRAPNEPSDSMRMADLPAVDAETLTHRLVLPRDANHHGTLYAGVLLSLALEAGYATAFRAAGLNANLVLKRVLDIRCYEPVPVGQVVQIRGREIHRARAQIIVALSGSFQMDQSSPWMDGLMQFVQVDAEGRPEPLDDEPDDEPLDLDLPWSLLQERARKLLHIK
jgi:acyl-CoA thioesterase YciA